MLHLFIVNLIVYQCQIDSLSNQWLLTTLLDKSQLVKNPFRSQHITPFP